MARNKDKKERGEAVPAKRYKDEKHPPKATAAPKLGESSTAPGGYFDVRDFGDVGTDDDTITIRAAAEAAKATFNGWSSRGLYFPPGVNYTATQPIDFRGISNVQCESWLVWNGEDRGPSFRFGIPSNTGSGRYVFHGIYDFVGYAARRHPVIQFSGLRGGFVRLGYCNSYMEVFSEQGEYENTAYSEFHLGQTFRLELHGTGGDAGPWGAGTGWINSNQFHGGALCQLRIGGPWHDVVSLDGGRGGTRVTTATPHSFVSGGIVEMYNGVPAQNQHGVVEVIDETSFTITGNYSGNGYRCMGRGGYPHNDNFIYHPNMEDHPAIIHLAGQCNHIKGARMEAEGDIICSPESFLNTVEVSNTEHGRMPYPGEAGDMTWCDYSKGNNFYGWVTLPKPWE
jgi:hypothetical protein